MCIAIRWTFRCAWSTAEDPKYCCYQCKYWGDCFFGKYLMLLLGIIFQGVSLGFLIYYAVKFTSPKTSSTKEDKEEVQNFILPIIVTLLPGLVGASFFSIYTWINQHDHEEFKAMDRSIDTFFSNPHVNNVIKVLDKCDYELNYEKGNIDMSKPGRFEQVFLSHTPKKKLLNFRYDVDIFWREMVKLANELLSGHVWLYNHESRLNYLLNIMCIPVGYQITQQPMCNRVVVATSSRTQEELRAFWKYFYMYYCVERRFFYSFWCGAEYDKVGILIKSLNIPRDAALDMMNDTYSTLP